jgi:hypothetical protein
MTAEGFRETEASGLRGEICIENAGTYPTENLSVVNTVQAYSETTVRSFSSTVDLSQNPVIDPGSTSCYPYELTLESDLGQAVQYRMTTSITVTNHTGLSAGNVNCRGSRLCPFGPEIITDLILPKP